MLPFKRLNLTSAPTWHFCEIGWQWSPPPLTDFVLWFVQSGHGELQLNTRSFELEGNSCFIFEPGSRPTAWHNPLDPLRIFSCHFTLDNWDGTSLWPEGTSLTDSSLFVLLAQKSQLLWRRGDAASREMARRTIEQMVLELWDQTRQPLPSELESQFDQLAEAIQREPARAWNLDDMAYSVNLSRAQFVRRFRLRFGCAPIGFVTQVRLERAQHLLHESELSLDSIARAVGYGDAPFLSKNFKKAFGMAPGVWRRLARNSQKNSKFVIDKPNESL